MKRLTPQILQFSPSAPIFELSYLGEDVRARAELVLGVFEEEVLLSPGRGSRDAVIEQRYEVIGLGHGGLPQRGKDTGSEGRAVLLGGLALGAALERVEEVGVLEGV